MAYNGTAVLPTGDSLNVWRPGLSPWATGVVYVMWKTSDARTRPTRVITSSGALSGWKINEEFELYHDQTGAQMGRYKVVGVKDFSTGEFAGQIPDLAIKHAVFK